MKRGDTARPFLFLLKPDGENAMTMTDVFGCTVLFVMKRGSTVLERAGEFVNGSVYDTAYTDKAVARYYPVAEDSASIGEIKVEVEMTTTEGKKITFPSRGYISLNIEPDLNP